MNYIVWSFAIMWVICIIITIPVALVHKTDSSLFLWFILGVPLCILWYVAFLPFFVFQYTLDVCKGFLK